MHGSFSRSFRTWFRVGAFRKASVHFSSTEAFEKAPVNFSSTEAFEKASTLQTHRLLYSENQLLSPILPLLLFPHPSLVNRFRLTIKGLKSHPRKRRNERPIKTESIKAEKEAGERGKLREAVQRKAAQRKELWKWLS